MNRQGFGLIHAYYGEGKGKTTAAVGCAVRALGANASVLFVQFLKSEQWQSSEIFILHTIPHCVVMQSQYPHPIYYNELTEQMKQRIVEENRSLLFAVRDLIRKDHFDLLVLDELLNCWHPEKEKQIFNESEIVEFLDAKPESLELILTGRMLPDFIRERAQLITETVKIKHPYDNGILARKGIEF